MDKIYQCLVNKRHVFASEPKQSMCPKCRSDEFAIVIPRFEGESDFASLVEIIEKEKLPDNKKSEFDNLISNAKKHLRDENFDEALKNYQLALELDIDDDHNKLVDRLILEAKAAKEAYFDTLDKNISTIPEIDDDELGLGILLMDVSDSMNQPAFKDAKITRLEMVAKSAAYGIFGLRGMTYPQYSFLHLYKFDHEVTPFLFDNVEHIFNRFGTPQEFETFLLKELSKRNGQTDINTSLKMAYGVATQFISGKYAALGKYKLKKHSVLLHNNQVATIPQVRVLLYTDGLQYVNGKKSEIVNPFSNTKPDEYDLLIGAFIGDANNKARTALENKIGKCPIHNKKQFFLIDEPNKMKSFKNLFKMASGASGFCPDCMSEDTHKDLVE